MPDPGMVQKRTPLLTCREAAAWARNSEIWWRKLTQSGGVPVVRLGRSVRLREDDVARILSAK